MPDLGLNLIEILIILAATVVGGVIRGFTGFGATTHNVELVPFDSDGVPTLSQAVSRLDGYSPVKIKPPLSVAAGQHLKSRSYFFEISAQFGKHGSIFFGRFAPYFVLISEQNYDAIPQKFRACGARNFQFLEKFTLRNPVFTIKNMIFSVAGGGPK